MNTLINKYDTLEAIIYNEGLSIHAIDFHQELDLMFIVLNTKAILHQNISSYHSLTNSSLEQLENYELIGNGTGVHWPDIDEDLSLKGFLRDEYNSKTFNLADNFKKKTSKFG
jgi:Protein of unknown function (DUF2442)